MAPIAEQIKSTSSPVVTAPDEWRLLRDLTTNALESTLRDPYVRQAGVVATPSLSSMGLLCPGGAPSVDADAWLVVGKKAEP